MDATTIKAIFDLLHAEASEASRESTRGPHNPFGTVYDDLIWNGTLEECWKDEKWRELADTVNERREGDEELNCEAWDEHHVEIEEFALDSASTVVGTGRPIYVAFADGAFPAVFCEDSTEDEVRIVAESFFGD